MHASSLPNLEDGAISSAEGATDLPSERFNVPILELFTQDFLSRHTRFTSFEAFLEAGHLNPEQLPNLDMPAQGQWDQFVRSASNYPDWQALLREAASEWLIRRLGIIIDA